VHEQESDATWSFEVLNATEQATFRKKPVPVRLMQKWLNVAEEWIGELLYPGEPVGTGEVLWPMHGPVAQLCGWLERCGWIGDSGLSGTAMVGRLEFGDKSYLHWNFSSVSIPRLNLRPSLRWGEFRM
jgi:hypothetical protein